MLLTMRTEAERDRANLQRRLEVLKLPVVPLERQGLVMSADPGQTMPVPEAVGVGPDGTALAVWRFRQDVTRKQVTWHTAGRRRVIDAVDVATDMQVSFVQPLPGGTCFWQLPGPALRRPTAKYGPEAASCSTAPTSVTPSRIC
jgi:hypothetical protein